jgi:hypothetical protein
MANPWDNDPIVSAQGPAQSGGNPWDKDPIVATPEQASTADQAATDLSHEIFPTEVAHPEVGGIKKFLGQGADLLSYPKRKIGAIAGEGDVANPHTGIFNHLSDSYAEEKKPEIESLKQQAQDMKLTPEQRADAELKYKGLEGNVSGFSMLTDIISDPTIIASMGAGAVKGAIKKFLGAISGEGKITAEKAVVNAAADRAGIQLTKEQQAASVGSQLPEGIPGVAERTLASTPMSRGIYETHKGKVKQAVMDEIDALKGTDLSQEEIAGRVAEGLINNLSKLDKANSETYQGIIGEGSLGINIGMLKGKDISKAVRRAANEKAPIFGYEGKNVPTGLTSGAEKTIRDFDVSMSNIESVPQDKRYQIFRNEKTNLGKAYADAEGPDKIALKNVYDAAKQKEEDFLASYGAFYKVDRDNLLETLKKVNSFYADTKPIRDFEKKAVGFNKAEGQKGYANAQSALNSILDPKKADELQVIMKLNPEELNETIRAGLMTKIFDKSKIENSTFVSLSKLQREVDKYGANNLEAVVGKERTDRLKDLMTGMQRARTDKLPFADPTNKSGTIAAGIEKIFYGGSPIAAWAGFVNPAVWATAAAAGTQGYINRLIAKVLTGTKFNRVESAIGKAARKTINNVQKIAPVTTAGDVVENSQQSPYSEVPQ